VATFDWNRWQGSTGISGNLRAEYATGQRVVAKAVAFAYTRRALCCAIAPSSGDLNA
jgi:hypothetical protein